MATLAVPLQTLQPGDLIILYSKARNQPEHVLLYTDDKQVTHNTVVPREGKQFSGVVTHDLQTGVLNGVKHNFYYVYRLKAEKAALARKAVEYAKKWSHEGVMDSKTTGAMLTTHTNRDNIAAVVRRREQIGKPAKTGAHDYQAIPHLEVDGPSFQGFKTFKSPYSSKRLFEGREVPKEKSVWTVESAFRAVKAYVRACERMGLSPRHGTTCDQFVIYCFQAASIEMFFSGVLSADTLGLIAAAPHKIKLYLQPGEPAQDFGRDAEKLGMAANEIKTVFASTTGDSELSGFLPQSVKTDAKRSSIQKLWDALQTDSDFVCLGSVNGKGAIDPTARPQAATATAH